MYTLTYFNIIVDFKFMLIINATETRQGVLDTYDKDLIMC